MSRKVLDLEEAMRRVGGDTELYSELIDIFKEEYRANISAIRSAVAAGDAKALEESSHAIKSALGNIGAMHAFDIAASLEKMGRENMLDGAVEIVEGLDQSVQSFQRQVTAAKENNFAC